MRHKAGLIGILAFCLLASAARVAPSYCHIVRSARDFHEVFRSLDEATAGLNPLERLVFSLMLTSAGDSKSERGAA